MRHLCLLVLLAASLAAADPIYVTAFRDPCRAIEVHRLVLANEPVVPLTVVVGGVERQVPAVSVALPRTDWVVHRALVDGLAPATEVTLRFPGTTERVRTLPADLARPLRIATGGDTMHKPEWLAATAKALSARDPDFVVLGGDLAYEDGKNGARVVTWIQTWVASARAPDGRLLPFVSCIGNHEVQGSYGGDITKAPYFYAMLPLGGSATHAIDIGDEVSVILLDSAHTTPIPGPQTAWLAEQLSKRAKRPSIIPIYHYPAWPTVKVSKGEKDPTGNRVSKLIREHWVPLFEAAGVRVVLENDQHTYKRTVPLKGGQPDPGGITYLGDGAWGVDVRRIFPGLTWLAKGAEVRHGYILDIHAGGRIAVTAVDETGKDFDSVDIPAR
ncbi:MAG TPA: hypothetical protein DCS97_08140 [Planctomycetes bacterium]|nr:hypothetical protein [Planctomycetota bacterium]